MANLVELKNIVKVFPGRANLFGKANLSVRAVDQVSLSIVEGESLSLVGESGCGKTTLARILMRLIPATSGEATLNGKDILKFRGKDLRDYRKNIQMVFQDPFSSLDPRFSVRSILKEPMALDPRKFKSEKQREARIREMMAAVRLKEEMLGRFPHEFSGGERQRIAIARALVMNPRILILDEAVSSLDVIIQEEILDLLSDLQKQFALTYVFISHNLKVVRKISDRIAVMYQGKVVELAATQKLLQNPIHPYTQELLRAAIEYKTMPRAKDFNVSRQTTLRERESGHWVLGE